MKNQKHKKKSRVLKQPAPRCPYCGSSVTLRSADGIYRENSRGVMLYVCSNYPKCDSYVRVHEGTTIPVGTLANGELRALRKEAHDAFNRLYYSGYMTRDGAYEWLASLLQSPRSQAHIGNLGEYYCRQVIEESKKLMANRKIGSRGKGGGIYAFNAGTAETGGGKQMAGI